MTNADDSPPSGSNRADGANDDDGQPDDGKGGSSSNATPSSLGINIPKGKKKGGSGFSIPKPSETGDGDEEAAQPDESNERGEPSGDVGADGGSDDVQDDAEETGGRSGHKNTLMGVGAAQQEGVSDPQADPAADAQPTGLDEDTEQAAQATASDADGDGGAMEVGDDDIVEEDPDPTQDQQVTVGEGDGEFDDAPTMISDEFFEANEEGEAEPAAEADDGGMHGEASLGDGDFEDDAFEEEGYEKTMVSDGIPGMGDDEEPGSPFGERPEAGRDSGGQGAAGLEADVSSDPASGVQTSDSFGQAPGSSPQNQNPPTPEQSGPRGGQGHNQPDPTGDAQSANLQQEAPADQSGEEFSSQKTEVFNSPFESDPITPKFTVLEGPSSGQEYLLNNMRNSVGRATDNSVVVPDEAMSRKHFEVVKNTDDTYSLKDLQSVNGTFLNGTKIKRADIYHGDRVKAGRTTLQFRVPGDRPEQGDGNRRLVPAATATHDGQPASAPQAAPKAESSDDGDLSVWINRIIIGATGLCLILMGVFLYVTVLAPGGNGTNVAPTANEAKQLYIKGVQAVKARNWDKARTHFEEARNLNPEIQGLKAQLKRLATEEEAKNNLDKARKALEQDNPDKALARAKAVPRESVYYEDARELIRRQKRKERLAKLYEKAERQSGEEEYKEALKTVQAILSTVPNHDKALALRRKILKKTDAELSEAEKEKIAEKAKKREKRARNRAQADRDDSGGGAAGSRADQTGDDRSGGQVAANNSGSRAPDNTNSGGGDDSNSWLIGDDEGSSDQGGGQEQNQKPTRVVNFTKGFTLYKQQNFSAAINHFQTAARQSGGSVSQRAEMAAKNIKTFQGAFNSANKALSASRWNEAASYLRKALRADSNVADSGFFRTEITRKLAEAEAGMGLSELSAQNYSGAYRHYKRAKQYDSSQSKVRDLRRKLLSMANSLYVRAASKKKTDPGKAASLCRTIKDMVPKSSKPYRKADSLLTNL